MAYNWDEYCYRVESVLDKEEFTLEELLDEDEIIQECKALNTRLINFLRDEPQVKQLLEYIVEEPSPDADAKRALKFPFVASEIFTCEIDVILETLVQEEELLTLLFSYLEPNRPHSPQSAGYFSKVVICLMLRKTIPLMNYVQSHQNVFGQLVDLIGITSIMEVLIRLVSADVHIYPNFGDVMQWLSDINLLEMIADKLSPSYPPKVHSNAAETLSAITRSAPSPLSSKLSSPIFVTRILDDALADSSSESGLVHSLSVCISLLDPKRSAISSPLIHCYRSQHIYESPGLVNPDTVAAMLTKLGDLYTGLEVTSDGKSLPTTYGELKPPFGKHRLKIVEFLAVLLRTGNEAAETEAVSCGIIKRVIDLFFEYPFNNALHHHVESIVLSCMEAKNAALIAHVLRDCDLLGKMLLADKDPFVSADANHATVPAAGKKAPRTGNLGHITRIANKLAQLGNVNSYVQQFLQERADWAEWQAVLSERNGIENVYRWACGRPTSLQDRMRDTDEEDAHDRDYDGAALANNLSQAFSYKIYANDDADEENSGLDRDDEDAYFDDDTCAEVVLSSLRIGDDRGSLVTNSNWFAFQDEGVGDKPQSISAADILEEINLNPAGNGGNSGSDDEVVVGDDDDLTERRIPTANGFPPNPNDIEIFKFDAAESEDLFADRPLPEWVSWGEAASLNPFIDSNLSVPATLANGGAAPSLFEEDVEYVGIEIEGTEKAMEAALKDGVKSKMENAEDDAVKEFGDATYWRVEQEVAVLE